MDFPILPCAIRKVALYISLFFLFTFSSCALVVKEVRMQIQGAAYCVSSDVLYKEPVVPIEKAKEYLSDPVLAKKFSPKSIRMAIAYNFAEDLKKYSELNTGDWYNPSGKSPKLTELQNKIQHKIQFARLDIHSASSEISCYLDRFTEILTMMKDKEDQIVRDNTLIAIAIAGVGTIFDGGTVYVTGINQMVILTGGVLLSYFSYRAFNPNVTVEFKPRSSGLKDVWSNAETSKNYSTGIWFLITKKVIESELTVQEMLAKRWVENSFLGEEGEERERLINLYFGSGGVSTITNMANRKEMNTQLRTLIQLFEQDLRALNVELMSGKKRGEDSVEPAK